MACPYCFQTRRSGCMDEAGAGRLVAFVERRVRDGTSVSVDWYGGEPLLQAALILRLQERIAAVCKRCNANCAFSMTTNGVLLTPGLCDALVRGGVRSFQITIDGPKDIHDTRRFLVGGGRTFETIISNVAYAIARTAVDLRVNIDQYNIQHIEAMLDDLSSTPIRNVRSISFKAVVLKGGRSEQGMTFSMREFSEISNQLGKTAANLGFSSYTEPQDVREFCSVDLPEQWIIDPALNVFKCADSFDVASESVGRIQTDGTMRLNQAVKLWRNKPIFDDPKCRECVYLPQCMGGCSLKKLVHRKDWCPEERFALPAYVQRLYEGERTRGGSNAANGE
ncbi:MAG: radical SAM protein [Pseudomonadales bacterium]|nr:radical SAM protein [Pseudomonadales bacterium]